LLDLDALIRLIAKVSDTFGGRPIRVVSGYRLESTARRSRHKTGHALDFSIPGVPNAALRDYVKRFPKVGVGYLPELHLHPLGRARPLDLLDRLLRARAGTAIRQHFHAAASDGPLTACQASHRLRVVEAWLTPR